MGFGGKTFAAGIECDAEKLAVLASSDKVSKEVSEELSKIADSLRSHLNKIESVFRGPDGCSSPRLNSREKAKAMVKQTELVNGLVHDLREVQVKDIKHPDAISCWRHCHGVKYWKSEVITTALRLICSLPMAGLTGKENILEEDNILEVFKMITREEDGILPHYFFVWGGIVRDLLFGKVGNDIDIVFTAPTPELSKICEKLGIRFTVGDKDDPDYIVIGDPKSDTSMEGYPVCRNSITPAYDSDFSMNWVFYDFVNDVIVDKTGRGVDVIRDNFVEIPSPRREWHKWREDNKCFRYFKFVARDDKKYHDIELAYVASQLLQFWRENKSETEKQGRQALSSLKTDVQRARLKELVLKGFELATAAKCDHMHKELVSDGVLESEVNTDIASAESWWQESWIPMLGW